MRRIDKLEAAINHASRLEPATNEYSALHSSSQPLISSAKVFSNSVSDIKCFECNQMGHIRNNCPRIKENLQNCQPAILLDVATAEKQVISNLVVTKNKTKMFLNSVTIIPR